MRELLDIQEQATTIEANEFMLVRTALSPREFERRAEQVMWAIDPEQSVFDFRSYDQRILDSIWQVRLSRMLLTVFGAVALILSAIGIYGVISFLVGHRRREIGIRLALGATPAAVRRLIVQLGALVGSMGAAVGLLAVLAPARIIEHRLSRVTAVDPVIFFGSMVVLITVSVLACIAPAWRASRLDPAITLRQE